MEQIFCKKKNNQIYTLYTSLGVVETKLLLCLCNSIFEAFNFGPAIQRSILIASNVYKVMRELH